MLINEQLIDDQKKLETGLIAMVYKYPRYAAKSLHWLKPSMLMTEQYAKFWRRLKNNITPNVNEYEAGKAATKAWVDAGLNMNGNFHKIVDIPDMDMDTLGDEIRKIQYMLDAERKTVEVAKAIATRDTAKIRTAIEGFDVYRNQESATMDTSDDVSDAFIAALESDNLSISSGIIGIDRAIGGFAINDATVIAGRPSMGKTALGLQVARNAAHQGKRPGFFSCEMSKVALWARMACPAAGVEWKDVIRGDIIPAQKTKLIAESKRLAEQYRDTLFIDDSTHQTVDTIWEKVIKNELDIVFVDHLSLLKDRPDQKEHLRLGTISMGLKSLAKSLDIAVVYLAQLNRGTEGRDQKRPKLSDLRDSGKIEENADTVLMMYRDEYYTEGADAGGTTEIWVRKFRNGLRNSKIELEFDIKKEWFEKPRVM